VNYYEILGVDRTASAKAIRDRFRVLARELHPDRVREGDKEDAERKFQELTEAMNTLTNEKSRAQHDQELQRGLTGKPVADFTQIAKAYMVQGVKAYKEGQFVQARDLFDMAVKHDPSDPKGFHYLALACVRIPTGIRQAVQAIEAAVRLDTMNPGYLKEAGMICRKAGLSAKAERYLQEALQWDSENLEIQTALSELKGEKGRGETKSGLLDSFFKKG